MFIIKVTIPLYRSFCYFFVWCLLAHFETSLRKLLFSSEHIQTGDSVFIRAGLSIGLGFHCWKCSRIFVNKLFIFVFQMDDIIATIRESNLKLTLAFGIGIHHAGLHERDRKTVEELFVNCKIQVCLFYSWNCTEIIHGLKVVLDLCTIFSVF